ncbi:MAG TPA: hypothetical protein VNQ76_04680, partial [Planctomicrobium sp.]|nr:hypothetical protein [Planctomicrobium sp.]
EVYRGLGQLQEAVRKTLQGIGVSMAAVGAGITGSLTLAFRSAAKEAAALHKAGADGAASSIQRFNSVADEIGKSFSDLKNAVAEAVAPMAEFAAKALAPVIRGLADFVKSMPGVVQVLAATGIAATAAGVFITVLFSKFVVGTATAVIMAASVWKLSQSLKELAASSVLASKGITTANASMAQGAAASTLSTAFGKVSSSLTMLTGRLPFVGRLVGRLFPLFGTLGKALIGAAIGFTAFAAAAVGVGVYLQQIHKRTGALSGLFDSFGKVGQVVAGVYSGTVAPVMNKLGDTMNGLFGGQASYWGDSIKTLSDFLGNALVAAAETAAGAIAILAEKVEWLLDKMNALLGIETKEKLPAEIIAERKQGEAAAEAEAEQKRQQASRKKLKDGADQYADRLIEDLKTADDRYADELEQLRIAREKGRISQDQYSRGVDLAGERRDEAKQEEYDKSPAGIMAREVEEFGDRLRESTRTAEEKFASEMAKIGQAFVSGSITAEVAQRGLEEAQKALEADRQRIKDESERHEKELRAAQLEGINRVADRRSKLGSAIGGDAGSSMSSNATESQVAALMEGGFQSEAFDAQAGYASSLRSRAEELRKRVEEQQQATVMSTRSVQEAMYGRSGSESVDEKLLKEYQEATRKADQQINLLENIFRELEG